METAAFPQALTILLSQRDYASKPRVGARRSYPGDTIHPIKQTTPTRVVEMRAKGIGLEQLAWFWCGPPGSVGMVRRSHKRRRLAATTLMTRGAS